MKKYVSETSDYLWFSSDYKYHTPKTMKTTYIFYILDVGLLQLRVIGKWKLFLRSLFSVDLGSLTNDYNLSQCRARYIICHCWLQYIEKR